MKALLRKLWALFLTPVGPPTPAVAPKRAKSHLREALARIGQNDAASQKYNYEFKPVELLPNVLPPTVNKAPAQLAMDDAIGSAFFGGYGYANFAGFPGYQYLSTLATRAEYRAMAQGLSTELTREGITIASTDTAGEDTKTKVTELTKKIKDIGLMELIQRACEHDCFFGRAQILIKIKGQKLDTPLILSPKTIPLNSFESIRTVEAIWTTPATYDALDPGNPWFYRPPFWYMIGQKVHATRLLTVITRPLPDMLKAAYNFGGISLSQLAEPVVDNWLRTRQAVADLINNFSIISLATNMSVVMSGGEDSEDAAQDLVNRMALFTQTRSNRGLMVTDKDTEEMQQLAVPLGTLDSLQTQALELLCVVSHEPAEVLTGVTPNGLNASSEGAMKLWGNWVAAQQSAFWSLPVDTILKVLQLSMYGSIDPDITWEWNPLFQMTPKEESEIRTADANTAQVYVGIGAVDNLEVREKLARDPKSGYQGLDLNKVIEAPDDGQDDEGEDDEKDSD